MSEGDAALVSNVVSFVVIVGLVIADSTALRQVGVQVSTWWGILLLPVYLILRTKRARSTAAVPVVWFVLVVGYALATPMA